MIDSTLNLVAVCCGDGRWMKWLRIVTCGGLLVLVNYAKLTSDGMSHSCSSLGHRRRHCCRFSYVVGLFICLLWFQYSRWSLPLQHG